jgi:hypothetical protein
VSDATAETDEQLRERLREAEAALAEARAERARLWEENNRLRAERRAVEHMEGVVAHMEGSVSWKVTEPLRTAKRLAMILQRRLDDRNA